MEFRTNKKTGKVYPVIKKIGILSNSIESKVRKTEPSRYARRKTGGMVFTEKQYENYWNNILDYQMRFDELADAGISRQDSDRRRSSAANEWNDLTEAERKKLRISMKSLLSDL